MSKSADAFRTISEVADWLGVPAHVLRFWESKFTQVKPVKRAGGRRYYRPADMQLLGGIRKLLHDDGMTIKGVQKVIREQGVRHVAALSPSLDMDLEAATAGIALDVPEQESEPRGQIVSFQRRPSGTAPARPAPDASTPAQPLDAPARQEGSAIVPPALGQISQPDVAAPAPPADAASEPAESAQSAAKEAAALPRIIPVDTPDDPADTAPAPPSALSALAGANRRAITAESARIADIARRLDRLRTDMTSGEKSL